MVQSLDLPVLSLVVPNICKLNAVTTDSISCMWTVFSKCKDNLENGRRLENMSWRLWFRESRIERPAQAQLPPAPVGSAPIQPVGTPEKKHVSPDSLKYILSSLGTSPVEEALMTRPPLKVPNPPMPQTAPLPRRAAPAAVVSVPTAPATVPHPPRPSKFFVSEDEDGDGAEATDQERGTCLVVNCSESLLPSSNAMQIPLNHDDTASLGDFVKQRCCPRTKQTSLLSSLLASHNNSAHRKAVGRCSADLSESLRTCVAWERYQNVSPGRLALHNNPVPPITSWFDTFRGW